jgi:hypothetical protein
VSESATYEVLQTIGEVEIRRYPALVLARVKGLTDDVAFRILFRYISGENKIQRNIAMTVPVLSSGPTYQRIAMTRPVLSDEDSFSFVMPSFYSIGTVPEPLDPRVEMIEVKPRRLGVLRFSGRLHSASLEEYQDRLIFVLKKHGIEFKGHPFLMRYNGPGTPGFLRRNEIAVELV